MKKKILSTLLAFATLFAIALPTNVYANVQDDYASIYLFTDNQEFFAYESQVLNSCGLPASIHNLSSSWDPFSEFLNNISTISDNSIVVVDIQKRFADYIGQYEKTSQFVNPFVNLENAFSTLRTKNCKIMFIDGTDEDTYQNELSFLDYVDVHVDTDFLYALVKGVVARVQSDSFQTNNENFYFITDEKLCNPLEEYYDFTFKWLLPYFKEVYYPYFTEYLFTNPEKSEDEETFFEFLREERHVRFFAQCDGNSTLLREYLNANTINSSPFNFDVTSSNSFFLNAEKAYMIGIEEITKRGNAWCNMVNSLKTNKGPNFVSAMMLKNQPMSLFSDIGVYNSVGQSRLMFFGRVECNEGIFTFEDILSDFISDNDMQKYNNKSGQCDITYMPITIGDDGWIPMGLIMDCFQIRV